MPRTILSAGDTKGTGFLYGDASYRTAMIRKQAVIGLQLQKTGDPPNPAVVMSTDNQSKKPLISEHHLTKGSSNGVLEFIQIKNKDGIF